MKNKQIELLLNLSNETAEKYSLGEIDEDVFFNSLLNSQSLGIESIFKCLELNYQDIVKFSKAIIFEKEIKGTNKELTQNVLTLLEEAFRFSKEREIDICFVSMLRMFFLLEYGQIVKTILTSMKKEEVVAVCDSFLYDESDIFPIQLKHNEDEISFGDFSNKIFLKKNEEDPILSRFAENLNLKALNGEFDNLIQFNDIIDELTTVLCKQKKPNAILIGPAGGGKTSNVELLAKKIVEGTAPELLLDKVIYSVSLSDMVAGTQFRGQFEERLKEFTTHAKKCSNLILFIDEIHTLVGAGGSRQNDLDASNILKPALARGEISCIGATTINEYNRVIKKDTALDRRFERIIVNPPSFYKMQEILPQIISFYEKFHSTKYSKEFVENLIPMCEKYMPNRHYPDKAVDIIDYCGALAKVDFWRLSPEIKEMAETAQKTGKEEDALKLEEMMNKWGEKMIFDESEVTIDVLRAYFDKKVNFLHQKENIKNLPSFLKERIVGQDSFIDTFIKNLNTSSLGIEALNKNKAPTVFCIYGEKNNGRSFFCSTIADFIKMNNGLVFEYNGLEFDAIEKVISSDADGNSLAQRASISPNSVIIIDDFDKINEKQCGVGFRQIFKEGRITKSDGEISDFSNMIFIISAPSKSSGLLGFGIENKNDQVMIDQDLSKFVSYQIKLENISLESLRKIASDSLTRISKNLAEKGISFCYPTLQEIEAISEQAFITENKIKTLENKIQELLRERGLI
jgi:ATP-dependent Clp protease ATP-binding subunit ClpA